jgi:NH3-dependent NAD+ synthetase
MRGVRLAAPPRLAAASRPAAPRRTAVVVQARKLDKRGINKVVLAYSGGLDTSVILKWLQDTYDCEVVTFTADLGQVGLHRRLCTAAGCPLLLRGSFA